MEMRKGHSVVAVMQTEIIQCFAHPLACHLAMSGSLPCLPSHFWTTPHILDRLHCLKDETKPSIRAETLKWLAVVYPQDPAGFAWLRPYARFVTPKRASLFWPMNINKLCWSLLDCGGKSGWLAVGIPAGLALPERPLNSSQLATRKIGGDMWRQFACDFVVNCDGSWDYKSVITINKSVHYKKRQPVYVQYQIWGKIQVTVSGKWKIRDTSYQNNTPLVQVVMSYESKPWYLGTLKLRANGCLFPKIYQNMVVW